MTFIAAHVAPPRRPTRYRRIANDLIAAIEAGEYPSGLQLPGESQLAEQLPVADRPLDATLRADPARTCQPPTYAEHDSSRRKPNFGSGRLSGRLARGTLEEALALGGHDFSNEFSLGEVYRLGSGVSYVADPGEVVEQLLLFGQQFDDPLIDTVFG